MSKGTKGFQKGHKINMGRKFPKNFGIAVGIRKKGQKHTKEAKEKMKLANLGKHYSPSTEFKKGYKSWLGKKLSVEHINNLINSHKGKKSNNALEIWRKKSGGYLGENHPNWKGGISKDKQHYNRERRVRKLKAIGSHTFEQWQELKGMYNYMCLCCKQQKPFIKLTEDHIIPLTMGGNDDIENIQPLCRSCNSTKHTKIINYKNLFLFNNLTNIKQ